MTKAEVIEKILKNKPRDLSGLFGFAFAPVNIALCKYWGKRDEELHLPFNSSLSISLGNKGAFTKISATTENHDEVVFNGKLLPENTVFATKIANFLALIRQFTTVYYRVETELNIPPAAGLASSAAGFAALVKALNFLHNWQLEDAGLSILARLGSGSACRSLWQGFVEWDKGQSADGMDSYGKPLSKKWPELRIGLLILESKEKPISSRDAMVQTVKTSKLYQSWPSKAEQDFQALKIAIKKNDFKNFAEIAENNAMFMHATMQDSLPAINYSTPETLIAREKIYSLRKNGHVIYFTEDAGPNLKLLFLQDNINVVREMFPAIEIIAPFADPKIDQVVLVDEDDKELDVMEKLLAHQKGLLHRAFSVFIIRKKNNSIEVLLQQRQKHKYHCGGLWSNACCSHPRPAEDIISAARRRLREEMGIDAVLQLIGKFQYYAAFENGLVENELDYVLVGEARQDDFLPNIEEVLDYRWIKIDALKSELAQYPQKFTPWFEKALQKLLEYI